MTKPNTYQAEYEVFFAMLTQPSLGCGKGIPREYKTTWNNVPYDITWRQINLHETKPTSKHHSHDTTSLCSKHNNITKRTKPNTYEAHVDAVPLSIRHLITRLSVNQDQVDTKRHKNAHNITRWQPWGCKASSVHLCPLPPLTFKNVFLFIIDIILLGCWAA